MHYHVFILCMHVLIISVEKVERTYELSDLTESFCLSVPGEPIHAHTFLAILALINYLNLKAEIVHKCIAAQIFADPVCTRR